MILKCKTCVNRIFTLGKDIHSTCKLTGEHIWSYIQLDTISKTCAYIHVTTTVAPVTTTVAPVTTTVAPVTTTVAPVTTTVAPVVTEVLDNTPNTSEVASNDSSKELQNAFSSKNKKGLK